jgi:AcrR family transcriptional regulator
VPRLWSDTIEEHRRDVRDAVLDATASLLAQHGPTGVTMSQVAADAGIGRATLYKYFGDVDAVIAAWHDRQIREHLDQVVAAGSGPGSAAARLRAALEQFAGIFAEHHGSELAAAVHHQRPHAHGPHAELAAFVAVLISDAAQANEVRTDIAPRELAAYCVHALQASEVMPSKAAVRRLVDITLFVLVQNQGPTAGAARARLRALSLDQTVGRGGVRRKARSRRRLPARGLSRPNRVPIKATPDGQSSATAVNHTSKLW